MAACAGELLVDLGHGQRVAVEAALRVEVGGGGEGAGGPAAAGAKPAPGRRAGAGASVGALAHGCAAFLREGVFDSPETAKASARAAARALGR
jgi:hypothetical protein